MAYDLAPVSLPRLSGRALKIFVAAVESRTLGGLLHGSMVKSAGFDAFFDADTSADLALGPILTPREPSPVAVGDLDAAFAALTERNITDSPHKSISDYAAAYRDGSLTPLAVAEHFIAMHKRGAYENAPWREHFIAVDEADVLQQAQASTERFAKGAPLSFFDGVPVPVKDELDMTPYPTTVGTQFMGKAPAPADAAVVGRLRAMGALLLGKTNMHELGIGVTGVNVNHGTPRNPYAAQSFCGGSSSGSAASAAAGFGPMAVGADGGGSVRIPAGLCGMVGLKPTFSRVSEFGAAPLCWSVAHIGPIAHNATDCALGYVAMAGPDPRDKKTLAAPPVSLERMLDVPVEGLRIGIVRRWFDDADPEVVAACQKAVDGFVERGATVVDVDIPSLNLVRLAHVVTIAVEMAASQAEGYGERRHLYSPDTRLNLALARRLNALDYVKAQRLRTDACAWFDDALTQCDVIATPTTGCVTQPIAKDAHIAGESDLTLLTKLMRFAVAANLTGLPAITFNAGYAPGGEPIGLQLMARAFDEDLLLGLAFASESFCPRRKPDFGVELAENTWW